MNKRLKLYGYIAMIYAGIVFLANSILGSGFTNIYYLCSIILLPLILIWSIPEKKKHNIFVFVLYLFCILSIATNTVNPVFQSFPRFLIFFAITLLIGPAISSKGIFLFRYKLFNYILFTINIVVVVSFILNLTGVYNGYNIVEGNPLKIYQGLFLQSMVMSPMAAVSFLFTLSLYLKPERFFLKLKSKNKLWFHTFFILVLIVDIISTVMAGSRGALLALVFALMFFFAIYTKFKISKFSKIIFITLFLFFCSFPFWKSKTEFLISKIEYSNNEGSSTSSRDSKWIQRFEEYYSSPVFGIGFASVDPKGKDPYNIKTGQIEPGSSWLGILSTVGSFGFISVVLLFYNSIIKSCKNYFKRSSRISLLLSSILVFFVIHMLIEGYFLSSGSLAFFVVWLSLSIADSMQSMIIYQKC